MSEFRLVSNSEVQDFKTCRRKWYLRWIAGLAPKAEKMSGVRDTGTRLHIALETKYQPGPPVKDGVVMAELLAAQAIDREKEEARGDFADIPALEKAFVLERIMLEGYLDWLRETGADSDLEIIEAESYAEVELDGVAGNSSLLPVKIIGKKDVKFRDRRTGALGFMDHKSVQTFTVPMLRSNQQALHYKLLDFLLTPPGEPFAQVALYNMLRRVKRTAKAVPPFYKRVAIEHNQHELNAYTMHLVGTVTDMQMVEAQVRDEPALLPMLIYPTPTRDCSWKCPFMKVCPMFDDGSRVEAALEEHYRPLDPLEYYQGKEKGDEEE